MKEESAGLRPDPPGAEPLDLILLRDRSFERGGMRDVSMDPSGMPPLANDRYPLKGMGSKGSTLGGSGRSPALSSLTRDPHP